MVALGLLGLVAAELFLRALAGARGTNGTSKAA
jgi:hypothetical protein